MDRCTVGLIVCNKSVGVRVFRLKRTLLLFIEQLKNGCGLVKTGRVPGKID